MGFNAADSFGLRERLRGLGVDREYLRSMTERGDDLRTPLTPTREAQFSDDPAAVAVRSLFCAVPVTVDEAQAAFSEELLGRLKEHGILVPCEIGFVSQFHLRFVKSLILFSDYLDDREDSVMGAGETTAVLYNASRPEERIGRALDLGCGAGTLALLLASDAGEIVGTDINQRAVDIANLNAQVNGISNVSFRNGDVYEPVAGERFDLIVSQPPYYPRAEGASNLTFLHGGPHGDEIPRRVVKGLPEHLTESGRGVVFTSWPAGREEVRLPGYEVLQLRTNRREVHGTMQTLNVVQRAVGGGWYATFDVPADSWGYVTPERIDEIIAVTRLLDQGPDAILGTTLRLAAGARLMREGAQLILSGPPESLIGCTPIDAEIWRVIESRSHTAEDLPVLTAALRRGFLRVG